MTQFMALSAALLFTAQETPSRTEPLALPTIEVVEPLRGGLVVLECGVSRAGRMRDCVIVSETPAGQGFGAAALNGAGKARVSRRTLDRTAPNGRVRFSVRFQLAE
jgi:protein TonB